MTARGKWLLALAVVAAAACLESPRSSPEPPSTGARPSEAKRFWDVYRRATEHRLAGRLTEAVDAYDEALRLRPDHEDALYYRANCAVDLRRYDEAVGTYAKLIDINGTSARGHMQLGLLQASLEEGTPVDLASAESHFRSALAVAPDSGALLALGELAVLRADWPGAADTLRQVAAGDAMSIAAPYLLGFLSWRSGHREEALGFFRTAVARGEPKKPALKWTEEGDVKADPALRWQAVARQTITGRYWIRTRGYLRGPGVASVDMDAEYRRLRTALDRFAPGARPARAAVSRD